VEAIDLARWTPVSLTIEPPAPTIDWCDLSDLTFSEPFFSQTLIRVGDEPVSRELVTTDLAALRQIDAVAPGRDPDGFIFHISRCGSSLVSQLAGALDGVAVLAEPDPINTLLGLEPAAVDVELQADCLRLLMQAYGRGRGTARRFIVKFSSWNLLYLDVLRRAFPNVPCVFVARDPAEVAASILGGRTGWMRLREAPARAQSLLGIPAETIATLDDAGFCVAVLEQLLTAAIDAQVPGALYVDYPSLPASVWDRVLPHFGITPTASERDKLREVATLDAKTPVNLFTPDGSRKRATLSAATAYLVEQRLAPLYQRYLEHCSG
jgi:hypothetical protein